MSATDRAGGPIPKPATSCATSGAPACARRSRTWSVSLANRPVILTPWCTTMSSAWRTARARLSRSMRRGVMPFRPLLGLMHHLWQWQGADAAKGQMHPERSGRAEQQGREGPLGGGDVERAAGHARARLAIHHPRQRGEIVAQGALVDGLYHRHLGAV